MSSNDENMSKSEPKPEITRIESSILSAFRGLLFLTQYFSINSMFSLIFRITKTLTQIWFHLLAIIWSSAFIYSMFYYIYIPLVSTTKEVHLQFDSRCQLSRSPSCATPFASIALTQYSRNSQFLRGQMYRFAIDLHLPESEVNWSQGMFMVRIKLFDDQKRIIKNVAKPSILRFRSQLNRIIYTLFYWPLLVIGVMDESQTLTVNLIDDFVEGSHPNVGPLTEAKIEIEVRDIQISPPTVLKISAHLSGLRYYMYYWPITSAATGISTIAFFLWFITFISYIKYNSNNESDKIDDKNEFNDEFIDSNDFIESCDSGLIGHINNENGSDDSSTLVIKEIDDIDIPDEDLNPVPDSSMG